MYLKESFKIALDGNSVTEFAAGEYDQLPELAQQYAEKHKLIEEKAKPAPANKARTTRKTKAK